MKITASFEANHIVQVWGEKTKKSLPHWNNIKMFYTCFNIVLVKKNYFKNKTPQIVQFQFSTAHFYDNLTENIPGEEGKWYSETLFSEK